MQEIEYLYPKKFRKLIRELWMHPELTLCSANAKITPKKNKFANLDDADKSIGFVFEFVYAGKVLTWEVAFDDCDLAFAPDVHFRNDQFLLYLNSEEIIENIPAWKNWNGTDKASLYKLIKEFLNLYKTFHKNKLEDNKYLQQQADYKQIVDELHLPNDNIEIYVENDDKVIILIKLLIDVPELPPYTQEEYASNGNILNPLENVVLLKVLYANTAVTTRVTTALQLSPWLDNVLPKNNDLKSVAYNKDEGLVDYIRNVTEIINDVLKNIVECYEARKEFTSRFLAIAGSRVLEFDMLRFTEIYFLNEVADNNIILVKITLSLKFPRDKPLLSFLLPDADSGMKSTMDFPYNVAWSTEKKVLDLLTYITEKGDEIYTEL